MVGMEKIGEAILDKVKVEAEGILSDAREKAAQEIAKAKEQKAVLLEGEKAKLLQEANEEAARIEARALVEARRELAQAKSVVIDKILTGAKKELARPSGDKESLGRLIKEAVTTLGSSGCRVYVSAAELKAAKDLVAKDKALSAQVAEVKELDLGGGVVVEDSAGKIRIDNTYDTRLEMILPSLLPEVGKELF